MKITPAIIFSLCIMAAFVSAEANITRQDAVTSISNALESMEEMQESGFSTVYINDTIIAAKEALQKTDTAIKMQYKGFSYEDVIYYTNKVQSTKEKAYILADSIRALEIEAEEYKADGIEIAEAQSLIQEAKTAFENERYEEAESIAEKANISMEQAKSRMTIGKAIARSARGFFEENWKQIITLTILILISGTVSGLIIRKKLKKRKLHILTIEKQTLVEMMKEAQRERFESGKISDFTYRIRMDVYKKKLAEVRRQIPVFEVQAKGK
ncbi:MAG: hypothetical protein V1734_04525 [Nanoarchaeota archaeon]